MRNAVTAMFVSCDQLLRGRLSFSLRTQDAEAEPERLESARPVWIDSGLAGLADPALALAHYPTATPCASARAPQWG